MSRRNNPSHELVVNALVREGWMITPPPERPNLGVDTFWGDIDTNDWVGAMREPRKIAVLIPDFSGTVPLDDFYPAYGQFDLFRYLWRKRNLEDRFYLAMPKDAYNAVFGVREGENFRQEVNLLLIVFQSDGEGEIEWVE